MLFLKTLTNKKTFTKANGDVLVDLIRRSVSFLGIRTNSGKTYIVTEETAMRPDLISQYFYQDQNYLDVLLKYNGYSNPFALDVGDILKIPNVKTLEKFSKEQVDEVIGSNGYTGGTDTFGTSTGSLSNNIMSRKKSTNIVLSPKTKKDKARLKYLLQRSNIADANLAKLNALINSGSINPEDITSQVLAALQGGNFSGTKPSNSAFQVGNTVPVPPNIALDNGVKIENGRIIFGSDVTNLKKEDCTEPVSRAKLKETLLKNKIA